MRDTNDELVTGSSLLNGVGRSGQLLITKVKGLAQEGPAKYAFAVCEVSVEQTFRNTETLTGTLNPKVIASLPMGDVDRNGDLLLAESLRARQNNVEAE